MNFNTVARKYEALTPLRTKLNYAYGYMDLVDPRCRLSVRVDAKARNIAECYIHEILSKSTCTPIAECIRISDMHKRDNRRLFDYMHGLSYVTTFYLENLDSTEGVDSVKLINWVEEFIAIVCEIKSK